MNKRTLGQLLAVAVDEDREVARGRELEGGDVAREEPELARDAREARGCDPACARRAARERRARGRGVGAREAQELPRVGEAEHERVEAPGANDRALGRGDELGRGRAGGGAARGRVERGREARRGGDVVAPEGVERDGVVRERVERGDERRERPRARPRARLGRAPQRRDRLEQPRPEAVEGGAAVAAHALHVREERGERKGARAAVGGRRRRAAGERAEARGGVAGRGGEAGAAGARVARAREQGLVAEVAVAVLRHGLRGGRAGASVSRQERARRMRPHGEARTCSPSASCRLAGSIWVALGGKEGPSSARAAQRGV